MTAKGRLIRNIVIAAVSVAVLGTGYYFAQNWTPKAEENKDKTEAQTAPELLYIVSESADDVSSVHIKNNSGEYDIVKTEGADGAAEYTIPSAPDDELNKSSLSSAFYTMTKLAASKEITDDVSKAADFGLGNASAWYTLKKTSGETVTVLLGDEVPTGGSYYAMVSGGSKIYTVGESAAKTVLKGLNDYRRTELIALSDAASIKEFTLYKDTALVMKIRTATEEDNASKVMGTNWVMEKPWNLEISDSNLQKAFEKLLTVKAVDFADASVNTAYDYKAEIKTEDADYCFSVGGEASQGLVYLRDDKTSRVFIVDRSVREALAAINPTEYLSKLILIKNIADVDSVELKTQDKTCTLKTGEADKGGWLINGSEIAEKDFKQKYQSVIGVMFKEVADGYAPQGDPYLTVTFKMKDGSEDKVNYYQSGEREYTAVCPDGTAVRLLKSELQKVIDIMN